MNELNRKLAEWAGFKNIRFGKDYMLMTGRFNKVEEITPFTQSLDACFKWLVPELLLDQRFTMTIWNDKKDWFVQLSRPHKFFIVEQSGTLALAVCLAVEKLIDAK